MTRALESAALRSTEGTTIRALEGAFVAGPVVYSDDFNRANGALGGSWEHAGWQINANTAIRNGASGDYARYTVDLGTPDHWVEVDVPAVITDNYMVVNARGSGALGSNFYMAFLNGIDTHEAVIAKQVSGGYSDILRGSTGYTLDTYKARLEVEGTAIRFYRNGVLVLSTTDSSLTTGNLVGLNTNATNTAYGYDNFRCGALPYTA